MKKTIQMLVILLLNISILYSAEPTNIDNEKLIRYAMQERYLMQKIVKDYMYKSNGIAVTKAHNDMLEAFKEFDKKQMILNGFINDVKIKNLLLFIHSNREDIANTMKKPYSTDNAQEIIDMAEVISEGEQSIISRLTKKLKSKHFLPENQRYLTMQVAKYYIVYASGIKDKNTISAMNSVVNKLGKLIEEMKNDQDNTPKMNQIMDKIDRDWKIISKFYLDIKEGDLPLIVYDTTSKLDEQFYRYNQEHLMEKNKLLAKIEELK